MSPETKIRSRLERFLLSPAHPILLGIYFVFRLYTYNIAGVPGEDLIRPLFISVLCGALLLIVFHWLIRDWRRAALMASSVLAMVFLYGLSWTAVASTPLHDLPLAWAGIWLTLTALVLWRIVSARRRPVSRDVAAGMNLMAIVLLLFPVMQFLRYWIAEQQTFKPDSGLSQPITASATAPDIYYIVLDTYGRADALQELYGYDNSPFLDGLYNMGFYVAECSQSNYAETALSIASALNLDYVQSISRDFAPGETDLLNLFKLLNDNAVRRMLDDAGYTTVAYASGFTWAEWRDADVYLAPPRGPVTEFEVVVLLSTFARVLDDTDTLNLDDLFGEHYRQRTRLVLDSFDSLDEIPGPKFVFMHIIAPHPPYVFDADGNPVAPDRIDADTGYINMVEFINAALLPQLQTLIAESKIPPVIILQGDHGPYPKRPHVHMKILNAYYLPQGAEGLYPSISPVNSFRLVFNEYFDTQYPLLEDISYFSEVGSHYEFSVEPNTCIR